MELIENRLAIGAPPFVAGDLHFHLAAMHELVVRTVGANRPDAVDEPPMSLVAIEEKGRIGRGKLQVIEPVRVVFEQAGQLAGAQIDREHRHRQLGGETAAHHFAFVDRLAEVGGRHARSRLAGGAVISAAHLRVAFDERAGAEGLVGVDRNHAGARRQIGEVLGFSRVEIDPPERGDAGGCGRLSIVEIGRVMGDDDGLDGTGHDASGLVAGEVENRNALGRGVGHPLAVGSVGVDVEIETIGARLAREANHAMAGVGIDPRRGRLLGVRIRGSVGRRGERGWKCGGDRPG